MAAITFDTLKFANRLEKAGIPREHAQAEAEALADVFEAGTQEATKADLREMEQRITARFERVDGRINEMRAEVNGRLSLQQWMLALVVVAEAVPLISKFFGH